MDKPVTQKKRARMPMLPEVFAEGNLRIDQGWLCSHSGIVSLVVVLKTDREEIIPVRIKESLMQFLIDIGIQSK